MPTMWLKVAMVAFLARAAKFHKGDATAATMNFGSSETSVEEMMAMAARVAETAFQQKRISPNVRRALSNASYYHEAVQSAGLPWNLLEVQQHIHKTALQLLSTEVRHKESLSSNSSSRLIDEDMKAFIQKAMQQSDLMGTMAEMSVGGFSSSMGVQDFVALSVDAASTVVEGIVGDANLARSLLGLTKAFPFTAALGGVAAGFLIDVLADFGLFGPSESQQLYDKIMKDVGAKIEKTQVENSISDIRDQIEGLTDELTWMPSMLKGETSTIPEAEMHTMLMFLITCQHDIAHISYKIRNSKYAQGPKDPQVCTTWISSCQWVTSMVPMAELVMMLQTSLITDIGRHPMVNNLGNAGQRIGSLVSAREHSWESWAELNLWKVQQYYRDHMAWSHTTFHSSFRNKGLLPGEDATTGRCKMGSRCATHGRRRRASSMGSCLGPYDTQCTWTIMDQYITTEYNKVLKFYDHLEEVKSKSVALNIHTDSSGKKWMKINQWTGGKYQMNVNEYGTVSTSGPGNGKFSDAKILELMKENKFADGFCYFKVTSSSVSNHLYIKTSRMRYKDNEKSFGWGTGAGQTYQALGTQQPNHFSTLMQAGGYWIIDAYHAGAGQSCSRFFLGWTDKDDCYHWDHASHSVYRCFSGGQQCQIGNMNHHPMLQDIQMYLRIK